LNKKNTKVKYLACVTKKISRAITNDLKRKLSHHLIQLITWKAKCNEHSSQGRICRSRFSRLRMCFRRRKEFRARFTVRDTPRDIIAVRWCPSPIKAKCSGKKKRSEKEAWGQTRKERRTKGSRERSSASVAGKNSGRCYSWCELSRGGFIMQQRTLPVVSSTLRLCPPGTDLPDLLGGGRKNQNSRESVIIIRSLYKMKILLAEKFYAIL